MECPPGDGGEAGGERRLAWLRPTCLVGLRGGVVLLKAGRSRASRCRQHPVFTGRETAAKTDAETLSFVLKSITSRSNQYACLFV